MDCVTIPQVRDREGNLNDSLLFTDLLMNTGNRELSTKIYFATMTPSFQQWFGNSQHIDELGQPRLFVDKDQNLVFVNDKKQTKVIFKSGSWGYNITESDVIQHLQKEGIINKNKIYGEYVLPRPLQDSEILEASFKNKQKPETQVSLNKIRDINLFYQNRFGITDDLVLVEPFGKTYKIRVNPAVLSQITQTSNVEALAPIRKPGSPVFEGLTIFKQNQIKNLEDRLIELTVRKRSATTASDVTTITKKQHLIEERLKLLKSQVAPINNATSLQQVDVMVNADLDRMEALANSDDYRDLEEAYEISRFYEHTDPEVKGDMHVLFHRNELFEPDGTPKYSQADEAIMLGWYKRAHNISSNIIQRRKEAVTQTINSNSSFERMFHGQTFTYEELFNVEGGLKDTSTIDMWIMDATNGIFSTNGYIPQMLKIAVTNAESRASAFIKEKQERMTPLMEKCEKIIAKLSGGKYKLSSITGDAVSWEIFHQKDIDGSKTGSLVQRYSKNWDSEQRAMKKKVAELQEQGKFLQAHKEERAWYRKNTVIPDLTLLPEVMAFINDPANGMDFLLPLIPPQGKFNITETGTHYDEITKEQIRLLKQLKIQYEAKIELALESEGVLDYNALSDDAKRTIEWWLLQNNPASVYSSTLDESTLPTAPYLNPKTNTIRDIKLYNTYDYVVKIPRRQELKSNNTKGRKLGFYDDNFSIIDQHPDLYEFHQLAKEITQFYMSVLPADVQNSLPSLSLGLTDKVVSDILFDPHAGWWDNTLHMLKEVYQKYWKQANWVKVQSTTYKGRVDPVTNVKVAAVNIQDLIGKRPEIANIYAIEKAKFLNAYNNGRSHGSRMEKITRSTRRLEMMFNQESISLLAGYLGVAPNMAAIKAKMKIGTEYDSNGNPMPSEIPIGRILYNYASNAVMEDTTLNLPRSLMLFSELSAIYAAKQEVKPFADAAMQFYKEIKKAGTQNTGKPQVDANGKAIIDPEQIRTQAIRQIDSWYKRAILGDYGESTGGVEKRTYYTKEEKKQLKDIDAELLKLGNSQEEIELATQLQSIRDNIGHNKSAHKRVENILKLIRLKGLGWNPNSAITNFLEGQIANEIAMSAGFYYDPKHWYKATRIVRLARRKALSSTPLVGKAIPVHPMANLVSILMNRYTVLQDSRNEFQKANIKTSFTLFEKLDPMLLNQSVEYLNQAPVMVAALMQEQITDGNGNTTSLFDAYDKNTGKLKPKWRTPENIENWENMNGNQYHAFKNTLNKCIVDTHGDYERLRGNLAKTTMIGKTMLMFKGWLPRAIYMRMGIEQVDIEAGRVHKGRYRSHTPVTATLHGAIVGAMFGPAGLVAGAGIGLIVGGKYSDRRSDLNYAQELVQSSWLLARKMVGTPINRIFSSQIIDTGSIDYLKQHGFDSPTFTELDRKNLIANLTEMALQLAWLGMVLLVKAKFYDEDDEEDDINRIIHNLLVNRALTMAHQSIMYLNPIAMYQDNIASVPVLRFLIDCSTLIRDIGRAAGGNNIDTNPLSRGENRAINQARKTFLPTPIQPGFGFAKQAEKQFVNTEYDKMFNSEFKNKEKEIKDQRSKIQLELETKGIYTTYQIDQIMARDYPTLASQIKNKRAKFLLTDKELKRLTQKKKEKKDKIKSKKKEELEKVNKTREEQGLAPLSK